MRYRSILPKVSYFGGLWKAGMKQFKHHFKRVAANKRFTITEFVTFSIEIEDFSNSRQLT